MKLINKILDWFKPESPCCKVKMKSDMLDMQFDKLVYQCPKCKKEWI